MRVMLEAGADPTLQPSRQAMMTDRIYKERFFPHELLADANGAPATDEQSKTIRGMLLDAIAARGGLPSHRARDLAALKLDEAEARARMKKSGRARVCDFCNKRSETKLRACGKCKFVFYCDAACQRKAWPCHKDFCAATAREAKIKLEKEFPTVAPPAAPAPPADGGSVPNK